MHGLQVSRKVDYGLRAMVRLAKNPPGAVMSFRDIAACEGIPDDYLAKIMRSLVVGKLVRSTRGPRGGYRLALPPSELTILDVIEAVEGPIAINACLESDGNCPKLEGCTLHGVFQRAQSAMIDVFRETLLADVLPAHATMPLGCDPLH
jgi:Rrf2 family protein